MFPKWCFVLSYLIVQMSPGIRQKHQLHQKTVRKKDLLSKYQISGGFHFYLIHCIKCVLRASELVLHVMSNLLSISTGVSDYWVKIIIHPIYDDSFHLKHLP